MAEEIAISKINFEGTDYPLKDKVSREKIESMMALLNSYGILENQPESVKAKYVLVKTANGAEWKKVTLSGGGGGTAYNAIKTFTSSIYEAEIGATVSPKLTWSFDEDATVSSVSIDGTAVTGTTKTYSGVKSTKTYTLSCTADDENYSKSVTITFKHRIYYGGATACEDGKTLSGKKLATSATGNVTVTAGDGKYIFICIPVEYGVPSFYVDGFKVLFSYTPKTFTNDAGESVNYNIFQSDYTNLGTVTIEIK